MVLMRGRGKERRGEGRRAGEKEREEREGQEGREEVGWEEIDSSTLLVRQTGEATVENSMEFPQKTKSGTAL